MLILVFSVKSINTSGHKFGLVYAGVGWIICKCDLNATILY